MSEQQREKSQDAAEETAVTEESNTSALKQKQSWFPLESNPEVINDYLAALGVDTNNCPVSVVDVYGLDEELLQFVPKPVYAVLLVYPLSESTAKHDQEMIEATRTILADTSESTAAARAAHKSAEYMIQRIGNACGTIGILHFVAANRSIFEKCVKEGSFLHKFLSVTKEMTPEERAHFIENDESLHKSQESAAQEGDSKNQDLDAKITLHFVAFARSPQGILLEFDGRKSCGPVIHGECKEQGDLLNESVKAIKKFVAATDSIQFSMTALAKKQ